jgi:hypothetical protein
VQALQAKQFYRLTSVNPSTSARIDNVYFSSSCVINYADTWNQTNSTNSMPASCRTPFTSTALSATFVNSGAVVSAAGIGTNNSGSFCSMRMASAVSSGNNGGAYDCTLGQANTVQLWGK